jgi:hypothetical protein
LKVSETFWLNAVSTLQDLAILFCLVQFFLIPRAARKQFVELGILLVVAFVCEMAQWGGIMIFHLNMNLAANIYNLFNLPLILLLYRNHIDWRYKNLFAIIFIIAFESFALINLFFIQGIHYFSSYTTSTAAFFFIVMSMTYLFGYMPKSPMETRTRLPMHWINMAILIYYATTFYIHVWREYLVFVMHNNLIAVWMVHNAIGIVYYGILSYSFVVIRKDREKIGG